MMAITESLPVGNEVATAPAGKTAAVDATAFAASFAAAGKASGGTVAGKNAGAVNAPVVPMKGQQDLVGWDAGRGLDGSGEETLNGPGQVGGGPDAGDGGSAVSSLIGKQAIVEMAAATSGGAGNEDLQQATVGAGMQQAVWTAGQGAGNVDGAAGTPGNTSNGTALPGAAKLDLVSHSMLKSASELGKDTAPSAVPGNDVPATGKVAASTAPAVLAAPGESDAKVVGKAEIIASSEDAVQTQVPSVATSGQPVANSAADESAATARIVAAKTETFKTATTEPHRAANASALRVGDKGTAVSGSSRKAEGTAEATLSSAGSGGGLPSATVEPGAASVVQGPTPVAPVVAASPVLNEETTASNGIGAKAPSGSGSEILAAPLGATDVAVASRAGARAGSSRAEVGSRPAVSGSMTGSSAPAAKRVSGPGQKNSGGENVVAAATASTSTGDGSSALPVVVGVAAAVPQAISVSEGTSPNGVGVLGVGAPAAVGQGNAAAVKDKDGKNATSGVQRGTIEARGTHTATGQPAAATTTSTVPENVGTGKNGSTHDGGSAAAVAGVASAPVAASNAHVATAPGWNGGLMTTAAPVRSEALGVTTAASASGTAKAEDGGLAAGLGSGLSSGLVESGQGHTTLQATPTVLEVGVPGGTHGWLKIRAELGEGGTVQASVSSATEAGQETLRKELPAMSAYLQSEHVPVSLQMAHGVATVAGGAAATGLSAGDGLGRGLGFGSGAGSHAGGNPEQSRNDAGGFAGVSTGGGDAGDFGSGRQQGADGGLGSGAVAAGSADGVSAAVAGPDADWTTPVGYGGVSLTTGGSWVNVIA